MNLTAKQAEFVRQYLVDLNATQAAIRAGYSPKTAEQQGYQLLQKTPVQQAIQATMDKRARRTEVSADRVLLELARIGFADIRKAVRWGDGVAVASETGEMVITNGVALSDSTTLDEDTAAAIAEIKQSKDGSLALKFHDKQGALTSLARHLGLFEKDNIHKIELDPLQELLAHCVGTALKPRE